MPRLSRPRKGSLQFYPRKRAAKQIPSANWKPITSTISEEGLLGFIGYKVGMTSALVTDNTADSMTKGMRVVIPVTILEVPNMKIFSVRFYKDGIALKDIIVSKDKELKKKLKLPKEAVKELVAPEGFDDIRVIAYSLPKQTSIKKMPDLIELGIQAADKLAFVKGLIGKEITLSDFLKYELVDLRALTKGKGLVGPVKRFGITLKSHKSEKGRRRPGSLGPWHPARVTFRTPMAGQLGLFSRVHYNFNVINSGTITENNINPKSGFKSYGNIKSSYIIIKGSVQGASKRQVLITPSFRPSKYQAKKKYDFVELIK